MASKKYIVKEDLHIRRFCRLLDQGIIGVLYPGFILDAVGEEFGDTFRDSNVWLKDINGFYYWKGATVKMGEDKLDEKKQDILPVWMKNLLIPEIWKFSKGKGVGVAVIDTGINLDNDDLKYVSGWSLVDHSENVVDNAGHGSHCSGLIGARNQSKNIIGIAPECDLYICKISDTVYLNSPEYKRYAEAIRWCAKQKKISIISISWSQLFLDENMIKDLQGAIDEAVNNNKVIVCSNGNNFIPGDKSLVYPAASKNTIGVGVIPIASKVNPYFNTHLDICTYGRDISSFTYLGNSVEAMSGSSQATAIVSGILALAIDLLNPADIPTFAENFIKRTSKQEVFAETENSTVLLNILDETKLLHALNINFQ